MDLGGKGVLGFDGRASGGAEGTQGLRAPALHVVDVGDRLGLGEESDEGQGGLAARADEVEYLIDPCQESSPLVDIAEFADVFPS